VLTCFGVKCNLTFENHKLKNYILKTNTLYHDQYISPPYIITALIDFNPTVKE
jgi:hypothetical protein